MPSNIGCAVLSLMLASLPPAFGQNPPASGDNPQSLAHIETAKSLAGTEVTAPFDFFCVPANARANSPDAPELQPVKLFDNLYAAGNSETVVYAITTSEGIILIDSGYADRVETVLVPGLRALGLDPANVKYILVTHGHADHFGGSTYFQDRYETRVGMSAPDWDVVERQSAGANPNAPGSPKRDLVLADGEPIRLGNVTVTPVLIPGHTPGSLAFLFPVTDGGTSHMAGLFGGAMLSSFLRTPGPALAEYVATIERYLDASEKLGVDVEIQNHPIFDDMPVRLVQLGARQTDEPHPFVIGTGTFIRFWTIVTECIQAEIARRGDGG